MTFSFTNNLSVVCFAIDDETTKLAIPLLHVRRTTGLQRTTPTPSLCRLFMEGRCRQGSQCHQIHADVHVVEQLRREVLAAPPCCQMHTPCVPRSFVAAFDPSRLVVVCGEAVPVSLFCPTVGLRKALEKQSSGANAKDLCRSHVSGGLCRYGDDCNYLHLCKTLTDRFTSVAAFGQPSHRQPSHPTEEGRGQYYCGQYCTAEPVAPASMVLSTVPPVANFLPYHDVGETAMVTNGPAATRVAMSSCFMTVVPSSSTTSNALYRGGNIEWRDVSRSGDKHQCSGTPRSRAEVAVLRNDSPLLGVSRDSGLSYDEGLSRASSPNGSATSSPYKLLPSSSTTTAASSSSAASSLTSASRRTWSHSPYSLSNGGTTVTVID